MIRYYKIDVAQERILTLSGKGSDAERKEQWQFIEIQKLRNHFLFQNAAFVLPLIPTLFQGIGRFLGTPQKFCYKSKYALRERGDLDQLVVCDNDYYRKIEFSIFSIHSVITAHNLCVSLTSFSKSLRTLSESCVCY